MNTTKLVQEAPYHPGYEDAVIEPAFAYKGVDPAKMIWKPKPLTEEEIIKQQADRIAELEKDLEGCEYFLDKQQNAEPVAWIRSGDDQLSLVRGQNDGYMIWKPLYTTPQIKELSDEEIEQEWVKSCPDKFHTNLIGFARAILKKASEK